MGPIGVSAYFFLPFQNNKPSVQIFFVEKSNIRKLPNKNWHQSPHDFLVFFLEEVRLQGLQLTEELDQASNVEDGFVGWNGHFGDSLLGAEAGENFDLFPLPKNWGKKLGIKIGLGKFYNDLSRDHSKWWFRTGIPPKML